MNLQDRIKKLNPKHVTLMSLALPVALAVLFVNFAYLPYTTQIKKLEDKVQQNESEISKSQVMQRKLAELKTANQKLQLELKAATEKLPSGSEEASLLDTITGLAKESGLTLKSASPSEKKPGPGNLYIQSQYTVEVVGGYHDIGRFMEKIDRMTRVLTVSNLMMSSAKLNGTKMNIPAKFTVLAFTAGGGK
jgi:type IV pilus assembly protein PilO